MELNRANGQSNLINNIPVRNQVSDNAALANKAIEEKEQKAFGADNPPPNQVKSQKKQIQAQPEKKVKSN